MTGVTGKRPPNIVEIRIAGKDRLTFTDSPVTSLRSRADAWSGLVVVEYDVLTPTPKTASITFGVTSAEFLQGGSSTVTSHDIIVNLDVVKRESTAGTVVQCPLGLRVRWASGQMARNRDTA